MTVGFLAALCFLFANNLHAQAAIDTTSIQSDSVEAKFPGGAPAWAEYLQNNLRSELGAKYLKVKRQQTVRQTVTISFLVNKEGKISEVTVVNPPKCIQSWQQKPYG